MWCATQSLCKDMSRKTTNEIMGCHGYYEERVDTRWSVKRRLDKTQYGLELYCHLGSKLTDYVYFCFEGCSDIGCWWDACGERCTEMSLRILLLLKTKKVSLCNEVCHWTGLECLALPLLTQLLPPPLSMHLSTFLSQCNRPQLLQHKMFHLSTESHFSR